jgi:hypothetical protein
MELGRWRSQKFSSIDDQAGLDRVATLILGWARTIHGELAQALESLARPVSVAEYFVSDLRLSWKHYAWNGIVKQEMLVCDLKPLRPDSKVVSSVSLGICRSVSQDSEGRGSRVLSVECAKVLVEEWFLAVLADGRPLVRSPARPSSIACADTTA